MDKIDDVEISAPVNHSQIAIHRMIDDLQELSRAVRLWRNRALKRMNRRQMAALIRRMDRA